MSRDPFQIFSSSKISLEWLKLYRNFKFRTLVGHVKY